jgi:hypothetical protein
MEKVTGSPSEEQDQSCLPTSNAATTTTNNDAVDAAAAEGSSDRRRTEENQDVVRPSQPTNGIGLGGVIWEEDLVLDESIVTDPDLMEATALRLQKRREIRSWNEQEDHVGRRSLSTAYMAEHVTFRVPMTTPGYRQSMRRAVSPISPRFSLRMTGVKGIPANRFPISSTVPTSQAPKVSRMIGTQIDERHQNFVLMYDMLMGIRTTVSRCNAKVNRELTLEDFKARHKLAFDV